MWPSRVLASGISPLVSLNICGDAANGLTATGTNAGTALLIASVWNRFTTVASSTGAILPVTEPGMVLLIANDGLNPLTVYPQSGSTIDGVSSVTIAVTKRRLFCAFSLTIWDSLLGA